MKTLFLEARVTMEIALSPEQIRQLPKELAVFAPIQVIESIGNLLHQLKDACIAVHLLKARHTQREGQILGCEYLDYPAPAFLYIGDGVFHPQALAIKNQKPVYCYNPYTKQLILFDRKEIDKIVKQHKVAMLQFLKADTIGILISTKPGQQFMKRCLLFKEKCEAKGKKVYLFLSNTIDFVQMNNFPFMQCWVNSACPRICIDDKNKVDKPMVNLEDVFGMI